jgi:hypothetical protein
VRVYVGGNTVSRPFWGFVLDQMGKCMQSYYWLKGRGLRWEFMTKKVKDKKVSLFLDSGAYSAFTQGVTVTLEEYIDFVKANEQYLEVYANLDVIGDAEATLKNQRAMEDAGLDPMPCYHYGEGFEWLEQYLDEGYEYIALGVAGVKDKRQLSRWLDHCWSLICDKDGMPRAKMHGFAITSVGLMTRYPWYSVDSTSWVMTSRFGKAYIPRWTGAGWDYYRPIKLAISARSPQIKEKGAHIDNCSPAIREAALRYFKEHGFAMGRSEFKHFPEDTELEDNQRWFGPAENGKRLAEIVLEPGLSNEYRLRDRINILFFKELERSMQPWPWAWQPPMKAARMGL